MADDSQQQPWLLVLLLALLGIGLPGLSRSSSTTSSAPAAAASTVAAAGTAPTSPCAEDDCGCRFRKLEQSLPYPGALAASRHTIIVTVPDPIDAVGDYVFDRALEAIRRALAEVGAQPDRFWLPWTRGDAKASGCRDKVPGWMFFRGRDDNQVFQVFLVGETSTWGVHPRAFAFALEEVARQQGTAKASVLIAGPTFSGSAPSLLLGLKDFAYEHRCKWGAEGAVTAHIISGSATSPSVAKILSDKSRAVDHTPSAADSKLTISYDATIPDDRVLLDRFFAYLTKDAGTFSASASEDGKSVCLVDDVAMLRETGTAYGAMDRPSGSKGAPPGEGVAGNLSPRQADNEAPQCTSFRPSLEIEYPAHIARIRTEYERQKRRLGENKDKNERELPPRALEISLGRDGDPTEVLPNLSDQTPYSEELVLDQALTAMCRKGIRWVGILGTDTIDRLFLAHAVKEHCPDVRLFFLESDVLYAHPEYGRELDGSLVLTPYPLLPQNSGRNPLCDTRTIAPFASQADQGLYDAVLRLEKNLEQPPGSASPGEGCGTNAPAWVTAIGNGNFWPIAVRPAPSEPCSPKAGGDAGRRFDAQGRHRGHHPLFLLLGVIVAAGYWAAQLAPCRLPWGLRWGEAFVQPVERSPSLLLTLFRLLTLAPVTLVLCLGFATEATEAFVNKGDTQHWLASLLLADARNLLCPPTPQGVLAVLIASLLMMASTDIVVAMGPWQRAKAWLQIRKPLFLVVRVLVDLALVSAGIALVGWAFHPTVACQPGQSAAVIGSILFRERNGSLSSGVSILLPALALAAALFLCGLLNLRRLQSAPNAPGATLFPEGNDFEAPGERRLTEELGKGMGAFAGCSAAAWLVPVVVAPVWLHFHDRVNTLERAEWSTAFRWGTLGVLALALASLLGFVIGWRQLRALLHRAASLPLSRAWSRLPMQYSVKLGGLLLVRPPDVCEIEAAVRTLRRLVKAMPGDETIFQQHAEDPEGNARPADLWALKGELAKTAADVDEIYRCELRAAPARRVDATMGATYMKLCGAAEKVAAVVLERWRAAPPPLERSSDGEERGEQSSAPTPPEWLVLGEDLMVILAAGHIFHALARLRGRLMLSIGATLLLLVMVISYPFEGQYSLLWLVESSIVIVACVAMAVFVQMERNEVLSRIEQTTPGRVSFNRTFLTRIVLFVLLPLFSVVAAAVPAIGRVLFGWIVPLIT